MLALITYPFMWLAALALPALISIYFLHHRYKRRRVSTLMLWAAGRQLSSVGQHLKRFSFPWIFLLELPRPSGRSIASNNNFKTHALRRRSDRNHRSPAA
ncbi:MAG: hypothetical protein PHO37_18340 [Kiritimatiellae bacterium]|nr:hypothetical protein [Kiritimatiellia bacterium]